MQAILKTSGTLSPKTITQNAYTRVMYGSNRKYLDLQNPSASSIAIFLADDPFGLTFDGGDHVDIDAIIGSATLLASTVGTIQMRALVDAGSVAAQTLLSISDASADEYLNIFVSAAGLLSAELKTDAGGSQWTLEVDDAIATGEYVDITLHHNGTIPKFYVNGQLVAQTLAGTAQNAWIADLSGLDTARLGAISIGGLGEADQFTGDISLVRIFDGVDNLVGIGRTEIARYNLDTGSGTVVTDSSGNAYDGAFGAGGAAPAWTNAVPYFILGGNGGRTFEQAVPQTGVWAYTTGAGVTMVAIEGFETAGTVR